MSNIIYHGSNVGYGFYCTNIEKQAKRWALTKRGKSIVNKYQYKEVIYYDKYIFS